MVACFSAGGASAHNFEGKFTNWDDLKALRPGQEIRAAVNSAEFYQCELRSWDYASAFGGLPDVGAARHTSPFVKASKPRGTKRAHCGMARRQIHTILRNNTLQTRPYSSSVRIRNARPLPALRQSMTSAQCLTLSLECRDLGSVKSQSGQG